MRKPVLLLLSASVLALPALPALAGPDGQCDSRRVVRGSGELQLRQIEDRVVPTMRGMEYIGPSYDCDLRIYQLRFMRDGRVVDVYVDARTGAVLPGPR